MKNTDSDPVCLQELVRVPSKIKPIIAVDLLSSLLGGIHGSIGVISAAAQGLPGSPIDIDPDHLRWLIDSLDQELDITRRVVSSIDHQGGAE